MELVRGRHCAFGCDVGRFLSRRIDLLPEIGSSVQEDGAHHFYTTEPMISNQGPSKGLSNPSGIGRDALPLLYGCSER
jgi:hypothetical protein